MQRASGAKCIATCKVQLLLLRFLQLADPLAKPIRRSATECLQLCLNLVDPGRCFGELACRLLRASVPISGGSHDAQLWQGRNLADDLVSFIRAAFNMVSKTLQIIAALHVRLHSPDQIHSASFSPAKDPQNPARTAENKRKKIDITSVRQPHLLESIVGVCSFLLDPHDLRYLTGRDALIAHRLCGFGQMSTSLKSGL